MPPCGVEPVARAPPPDTRPTPARPPRGIPPTNLEGARDLGDHVIAEGLEERHLLQKLVPAVQHGAEGPFRRWARTKRKKKKKKEKKKMKKMMMARWLLLPKMDRAQALRVPEEVRGTWVCVCVLEGEGEQPRAAAAAEKRHCRCRHRAMSWNEDSPFFPLAISDAHASSFWLLNLRFPLFPLPMPAFTCRRRSGSTRGGVDNAGRDERKNRGAGKGGVCEAPLAKARKHGFTLFFSNVCLCCDTTLLIRAAAPAKGLLLREAP